MFAATPAMALEAKPLEPAAERGRAFVQYYCGRCHATGKTGVSPLSEAPPFRTLHERYPIEDLAESFAEGIQTGHPTMPAWRLDPGQISDLLAYIKTLNDPNSD